MSTPGPRPELRVAVALVRRDGRWLVARRRAGAHLGGLWEFPGGKCETDETVESAALRELSEECAVAAEPQRTLRPLRYEYPERIVHLHAVVCRWLSGEPRPLGCDECRWVTTAELAALDMPVANAEILSELAAIERLGA
ncbi:MAG TPA: (deoxy)nucleoside triphosphate pyrophosphohydrolase [Phycisphaerae bacterium]|nr:(deoxy)nucleoside triphosphate pyrophosphohydrolase [Phycisphaerae bacterium]